MKRQSSEHKHYLIPAHDQEVPVWALWLFHSIKASSGWSLTKGPMSAGQMTLSTSLFSASLVDAFC